MLQRFSSGNIIVLELLLNNKKAQREAFGILDWYLQLDQFQFDVLEWEISRAGTGPDLGSQYISLKPWPNVEKSPQARW